jgi:hypothetical protein
MRKKLGTGSQRATRDPARAFTRRGNVTREAAQAHLLYSCPRGNSQDRFVPLSWNEIRDRAIAFSKEWKDETREQAEAQTFWNEFFKVFGIERKRVAIFEKQVDLSRVKKKLKSGRIDAFWKGVLLVEHKSAGGDLDKAFAQAADYFDGIAERDLPNYILVSDFARFRLYDLEADEHWEFPLKDLHKHIKRFGFIAGYAPQEIKPQDPVNIKAAEKMGRLHDQLKASGYEGHDLEVLLVRLVFCMFADDTGIFSKQSFRDWLETRTAEDGSDLGQNLALLFQVLNTDLPKRQKNLDEQLAAFAYINGDLFKEVLQVATFDSRMRATLLDCCAVNWGAVSPAIFGALFQSIMNEEARRNLGAHYTSEENILKLIKPLFLDDLWVEFHRIKGNKNKLFDFHKKLHSLTFFDPACGCGNFLVITYRELRLLELEILRATRKDEKSAMLLSLHSFLTINVDQFYGIEIEEFPCQIAQVALWLIDHQMNQLVSQEFGIYFARIPLTTSPHIVHDNALQTDWSSLLSAERLSYIISNPPFVGKQYQSPAQKADMSRVFQGLDGAGVLDFVTAWYVKAARYIKGTRAECAFVSTNSITQGEQVLVLWPALSRMGVRINFAHRTFQWSNEARGVAAVHCVIVGFALFDRPLKTIFEYDDPKAAPHAVTAQHINAYLVDAADVFLEKRRLPICRVPEMAFGSMPNDGGHLLLSEDERLDLIHIEPDAKQWIRKLSGSEELINNIPRFCLWLQGIEPAELRRMPAVLARVEKVRAQRSASKRPATQSLADTPTIFGEVRQPHSDYLAVPEVSSEGRRYIPIAFLTKDVIATNKLYTVANATLFEFGVITSAMHNAWIRAVAGRLESRIQYSAGIVYNNFPWPEAPTERQIDAVQKAAKTVIDTRAKFSGSSLADLYDRLTMPAPLLKAHEDLDRAVDAMYGKKAFSSDSERVALLFDMYQRVTSFLPGAVKPTRRLRPAARKSKTPSKSVH